MAKSPTKGKSQTRKPQASKSQSGTELIRSLIEILDEANLSELEYETEKVSVRIARSLGGAPMQPMQAPAQATAPQAASAEATATAEDADANHPGVVTSPMVGTVYTAPEPNTPPFISEGDSVQQGQTLVIVEAMKVMNTIAAPQSGVVKKILITNASPVEFGTPLVIIE